MAVSFTNYQIRCGSADKVVQALRPLLTNRAYVSPPLNNWVSIYDDVPDSEDDVVLHELLTELSVVLDTDVWVFGVYNSDVFQYFVYDRGEMKDAYDSKPDLDESDEHEHDEFCNHDGTGHGDRNGSGTIVEKADAEDEDSDNEDGEDDLDESAIDEEMMDAVEGNVDVVLSYCLPGTTMEAVETLLFEEFVLEEDRCKGLARLLDIDEARATCGLEQFEQLRSTIPGHRDFVLVEKETTE